MAPTLPCLLRVQPHAQQVIGDDHFVNGSCYARSLPEGEFLAAAYATATSPSRCMFRYRRVPQRYWRKMLSSRSWDGTIWWEQFHRIKEQFPLLRPKLYLPYRELQAIASPGCESPFEERSAGKPHATFCGSRGGGATASGNPVVSGNRLRQPGGIGQPISLPRPDQAHNRPVLVSPLPGASTGTGNGDQVSNPWWSQRRRHTVPIKKQ